MNRSAERFGGRPARCRQSGMLLLSVLVFLAIAALGLTLVTQRWSDAKRRDDEEELLRVGMQYRLAIESYYNRSPGRVKQLPGQLEDLVKDPRFPAPVRHLREVYADPLAPAKEWGLLRRGTAIVGVYSQAEGRPFRQANLTPWLGYEVQAETYEQWRFSFTVPAAASGASAANPAGNNLPGGNTPLPGGNPGDQLLRPRTTRR